VRFPATVVLILALSALPLAGTDKTAIMTKATVTIVPNIGALSKICNSNVYIDACTAFREVFSCSCKQMLQQWRLDVSVRVTPSMFLWKLESAGHENDHIGDIRVAVLQYVNDLDERRYPSFEECRDVAQHETDGFHHLMDTFKEDSNAKRHPFYRRRLPALPKSSR
jgi:hypothetical protein